MKRQPIHATPRVVISIAVVALLGFSEFGHNGAFFSKATMATLTPFIGVMIIASLGQALVIGGGGIDLSIPSTMTLVGVIVLRVARIEDDRVWLAIAAALGACVVIGVINGLAVEALSLNPFVATLAIGQIIAGVARYIRGPVPQFTRVPAVLTDRTRWNAEGISVAFLVAAALVAVAASVLRSTVWGRRLVASSASKATATFVGLRSIGYRILTYVASAVLAGLAAILLSGQLGAPDLSLGSPYLLATVVSVVLSGATLTGGRVDAIGVALGAVFITVLDHDLRVRGYSSGFAQLVQATVLGGGLATLYALQHRAEIAERIRRTLPFARGGITPDFPVGN